MVLDVLLMWLALSVPVALLVGRVLKGIAEERPEPPVHTVKWDPPGFLVLPECLDLPESPGPVRPAGFGIEIVSVHPARSGRHRPGGRRVYPVAPEVLVSILNSTFGARRGTEGCSTMAATPHVSTTDRRHCGSIEPGLTEPAAGASQP